MKNSEKLRIPKVWIVLAIILAVIIVIFASLSISLEIFGSYNPKKLNEPPKTVDYKMSEIFKDKGDTLVTDIAMLGSHDAFSNQISKSSKLDPAETSTYMAFPIVRQVTSHFAKAQTLGAKSQVENGVRYFDVRLSLVDGNIFSKHVFLSGSAKSYFFELIGFANENKGEVIVLDFQHIFLDNGDVLKLFDELSDKSGNPDDGIVGTNIFDHVYYDTSKTPLAKLTYDDVTKNGTETGFVILMKDEILNKGLAADNKTTIIDECISKIYSRDNSIISTWHNKLSDEDMFNGIDNELLRLKTVDTTGIFVVNQAQKTPSIAPQNIFLNLLTLADDFNFKHLTRENFDEQLKAMPIFMVDNSTTIAHNFNYDVMIKILNYNMNLK